MDIGFLLNWYHKDQFSNLKRKDEEKGHLWIVGEAYESLEWNCTLDKPTFEDLKKIQTLYDESVKTNQYILDRKYPPNEEQFDMQYWDLINGTTIWKDTITALKKKSPKSRESH